MVIHKEIRGTVLVKGMLDIFIPLTVASSNWKHWKAVLDLKTCEDCRSKHGKIYAMNDIPNPMPPLHYYCRCEINPMRAVKAGMGSYEGENGADWWLWNKGVLPDYYIYIDDLYALGWRKSKAPAKYALNKWFMVGYTETMKVCCRMHPVVYGLKQTLITTTANGTDIGCCGQMTA